MVEDACRLCAQKAPLVLSHVIPRFAVKWLKETSATGYFRNLTSKVRQQETKRPRLLCSNCEQLLGRDEKRFAEAIFVPYHQQPRPTSFTYEEWFLRFLVGLHWRALVTSESIPQELRGPFATAETRWQQYLLGHAPDPGTSEFHVQFVDVIQHTTFKPPSKINWYLARSFDATPIHSAAGEALLYFKLGCIVAVSFITPRNPKEEDLN